MTARPLASATTAEPPRLLDRLPRYSILDVRGLAARQATTRGTAQPRPHAPRRVRLERLSYFATVTSSGSAVQVNVIANSGM